jgi:uncharacterized membrane protein
MGLLAVRPEAERRLFETAVLSDVRIGFERTIEQDIGFGIRQQIDIACKALSPAINDPYTAVQANDHLTVVCCDLAVRPLGAKVLSGSGGRGRVVVPGNSCDYIFFIGGLFGHYGSSDVTVMLALVRLFRTCVEVLPASSDRLDVLDQAAAAALAGAERSIPRPSDLERIRAAVASVRSKINLQREIWRRVSVLVLVGPTERSLFFQVKKA